MVVCLFPQVKAVMTVHELHGQHGAGCLTRLHVKSHVDSRERGQGSAGQDSPGISAALSAHVRSLLLSLVFNKSIISNFPQEIIFTFFTNISDWGNASALISIYTYSMLALRQL